MPFTEINHYVPRWYQKRFITNENKENKFYYLDLYPDRIKHPDGNFHLRKRCRRLGPGSCFSERHLYTLSFGNRAEDVVERRFFGEIDRLGCNAVNFFSDYVFSDKSNDAFQNLVRYMDAQKLRTPKGLAYLKNLSKDRSHNSTLIIMRQLWQFHVTIWTEGVWEIIRADQSDTKFIVSDHPVTTYNKRLYPLSPQCPYPTDAPIDLIGTHTIFPLDINRCLVITNLGYVRNPNINPLIKRENPRHFATTIFDVRKVQTGRTVSEDYVRKINFIIKRSARRYLASENQEWLYPERFIEKKLWSELGDRFFLMPDPRKVSFSTGFFMGFDDGSAWGMDEYGRIPMDDDPVTKRQRAVEWKAFQQIKKAWDDEFGELPVDKHHRYL